MGIEIRATDQTTSTLGHIGTVKDVLASRVSPALHGKTFHANNYQYAFELASPRDEKSMGESIIVNGNCYCTDTDKNSPSYLKLAAGPDIITSGIFIIPRSAKPTHTIIANNVSLTACYQAIYDDIKGPFALAGFVDFKEAHMTYITKAPINGRSIMDNPKEYLTVDPSKKYPNKHGFIVGAASDYQQDHPANDDMKVVLYHNPNDKQTGLSTHVHLLELDTDIKHVADITPDKAKQVWHVFEDNTEISRLSAEIYAIDGLNDLSGN
jgi:hypothetical protein